MITSNITSIDKTQHALGERIRQLRIRVGLTQAELAERANTGIRAVRNLERGEGTTLETLIRALHALGAEDDLKAIAPKPSISPMAKLRGLKHPRRVRRARKE